MPNSPLTPSRRSELRSQAHKLNPVVIIGDKGLTDEVVAEIDRSLKAHELIKVRAATDDRKLREEWMGTICGRLEAHAVQQIGKVLVIYRENPDRKPEAKAPQQPPPSRRRPREETTPSPRRRRPREQATPSPRRRRPRSA